MTRALVEESVDLEVVPANDEDVKAFPENDQQLAPWIDTFALAIAAGVRVGARGMHVDRAPPDRNAKCETEVMDVDEVAEFLRVDRKTVYDYAARGEIPSRRLGKRILFSRTALMAWLGSCKVAARGNGD